MNVLVSALLVTTESGQKFAGVGRHMFRVLERLATFSQPHHYHIFVRSDLELPASWKAASWITWHPIDIKSSRKRIIWEHFQVLGSAKKLRCQAIFALFVHVPLFGSIPVISVAHDAFPRSNPEWYPGRKRILLDQLTASACRRSSIVITVSEFSRSELVKHYHIAESKVLVAPNGLGNELSPMDIGSAQTLKDGLLTASRYIFTISTLEPRKNLDGLIRAFNLLKSNPEFSDLKLVVAGAKGWLGSAIQAEVEASPVKDDIVFLGYISELEMNAVMQLADVFAFVSHVEGFGIPVLEAMTLGTPVVCSNTSSLPEVAGDCANYCNPSSEQSIRDAIQVTLENPQLTQELARKGLARAENFHWGVFVDRLNEAISLTDSRLK